MPYDHEPFDYIAPPGLTAPEPRHPVIIVGAGPIGVAMALELASHGIRSVVLDDNNVVSVGSRAICWSKRSLEILDRLGVGDRVGHYAGDKDAPARHLASRLLHDLGLFGQADMVHQAGPGYADYPAPAPVEAVVGHQILDVLGVAVVVDAAVAEGQDGDRGDGIELGQQFFGAQGHGGSPVMGFSVRV